MMASRREELQEIIAKARKELLALTEHERAIEAQRLLGKCFKCRNSSSCAEADEAHWWRYIMPVVHEGGRLRGLTFQRDCHGEVKIHFSEYLISPDQNMCIEISPEEFWASWRDLLLYICQGEKIIAALDDAITTRR
jgi:hypothetical protein